MNEIRIKDIFKTLTLFFVLAVFSVILVYSNFEQGVEDFWVEEEELADAIDQSGLFDLIDLDSIVIEKDIQEANNSELIEEYIKTKGDVSVFDKIFQKEAMK